jgi:hypothetical protein
MKLWSRGTSVGTVNRPRAGQHTKRVSNVAKKTVCYTTRPD